MTQTQYFGEFSWELLINVPLVYDLFLSNQLASSVGCSGTEPFYFFTDKHQTTDRNRDSGGGQYSVGGFYGKEFNLPFTNFPDYKSHYSNLAKEKEIFFRNPVITINNKSTEEWSRNRDFNRIELDELELIVKKYPHHDIVYARPTVGLNFPDNCNHIEFEDKQLLKNFSNVYLDEDLQKKWDVDFNTMQLIAHSLSEKHFSAAGGNAVLASFFGGINVIATKSPEVLSRPVWSEGSYLENISNCKIFSFDSKTQLQQILSNQEK